MKTRTASLVFLATTLSAAAQEAPPPQIDASRQALMKFVASIPEPPPPPPRKVTFHVGAIEFRAFGTRWRFNYLPIMMPLSGTRPTTTREWPDPFELTQTSIATPPRAWHTQRRVNAELRRIEKLERAKLRVKKK